MEKLKIHLFNIGKMSDICSNIVTCFPILTILDIYPNAVKVSAFGAITRFGVK